MVNPVMNTLSSTFRGLETHYHGEHLYNWLAFGLVSGPKREGSACMSMTRSIAHMSNPVCASINHVGQYSHHPKYLACSCLLFSQCGVFHSRPEWWGGWRSRREGQQGTGSDFYCGLLAVTAEALVQTAAEVFWRTCPGMGTHLAPQYAAVA